MLKLSIIIPVYNESATLEEIVRRINGVELPIEKEIIIIDDHSTDGSREIIKELGNKYKVVLQEKNLGKGAAIHAGLKVAAGDYVIIQDADLEYDPRDYQQILKPLLNGESSVVYGSRNLLDNPRFKKSYYYGGRLVTLITNLLFGNKLTDVNTCYKAFATDLLKSLQLQEEGFSFCEEVTAKVLKQGLMIKEVPINYQPRKFEEGKKIRFKDGILAILTLLKYKFFYYGK